jgi:hypothetical protein
MSSAFASRRGFWKTVHIGAPKTVHRNLVNPSSFVSCLASVVAKIRLPRDATVSPMRKLPRDPLTLVAGMRSSSHPLPRSHNAAEKCLPNATPSQAFSRSRRLRQPRPMGQRLALPEYLLIFGCQ